MVSDWLSNLKVGDEVAWVRRGREDRYYVGTVFHITKTQVVVADKPDRTGFSRTIRFRKSDCRELGPEPGTCYRWLIEAEPDICSIAAEQEYRESFDKRLDDTDTDSLTIDQLRRIVAILDEPRKDGEE